MLLPVIKISAETDGEQETSIKRVFQGGNRHGFCPAVSLREDDSAGKREPHRQQVAKDQVNHGKRNGAGNYHGGRHRK